MNSISKCSPESRGYSRFQFARPESSYVYTGHRMPVGNWYTSTNIYPMFAISENTRNAWSFYLHSFGLYVFRNERLLNLLLVILQDFLLLSNLHICSQNAFMPSSNVSNSTDQLSSTLARRKLDVWINISFKFDYWISSTSFVVLHDGATLIETSR